MIKLSLFFFALTLVLQAPSLNSNGQTIDSCISTTLGIVQFNKNSVKLTAYAKRQLDSIIQVLKYQSLNCRVEIIGTDSIVCEFCVQRIWERVSAVIKYIEKSDLSSDRLIFRYGDNNDNSQVKIVLGDATGPNMVPEPFPTLRKRSLFKIYKKYDGHSLLKEH